MYGQGLQSHGVSRAGSQAPAGQGTSNRQLSAMRSYNDIRASYVSFTCDYSSLTANAIDREERPASPTAPPVPQLPVNDRQKASSSAAAVYYPRTVSRPKRTNSSSTDLYAATSSDRSWEHVTHADAPVRGRADALACLEGRDGGAKFSPPHYCSKQDFEKFAQRKPQIAAQMLARNIELHDQEREDIIDVGSFRTYKPITQIPKRSPLSEVAAAADRARHELLRHVDPETNFLVGSHDGYVQAPDSRFVPDASNLTKQSDTRARFLADKAKTVAQRAGFSGRSSEASSFTISSPITGTFANTSDGTHVFPDCMKVMPIDEAQRKHGVRSERHLVQERTIDATARYPNALKPRTKPANHTKKVTFAPLTPPQQSTPTPDAPRRIRRLRRETTFGDFVNVPSDSSEDDALTLTPTPVPARKPVLKQKKPAVDPNKALPSLPAEAYESAKPHVSRPSRPYPRPDKSLTFKQQLAAANLPEGEKREAHDQVTRAVDQMENRRALGDDADGRPTTIIDTYIRLGHTSWRMTEQPDADHLDSYYAKVDRADHDRVAAAIPIHGLAERAMRRRQLARPASPEVAVGADAETDAVWNNMHRQMYGPR